MTPGARLRAGALPVIAAALVSGVLGVQIANGGGDFTPARPAAPCAQRSVTSESSGIEGLGERLVLLGLDGAACRLGVTREALTLELAQSGVPTDAQVNALRAGLLQALDHMKADGTLPPASELTDEALDNADLNRFIKAAIRALPDSVINAALKIDDVLRRTINELDLRSLLTNLNDPDELTRQINAAVTDAVKSSLVARLRDLH
ncbi:MAG: hypothetical protein DLM58_09645 [Pseudonocardiales bacterium]|nr:MAG: hypothetical protein DLM58_09645 [Pseudonocardiales bacterium]